MQRKLNEEFIKEYSEDFSQKVASSFFGERESISGKEILNLTSSRQVNLFVLKTLFQKWQEEMKRLESPYFNYKATEVRKAMVQFMNTLSQHIEVSEEHLSPMLEQAVADTLLLVADPGGYLALEFDELDVNIVTEKVTKPIFKYIKLHKNEMQDFFDGNIDLPQDEFIDAADDYFEDLDISVALDEELGRLSDTLPISENDLFDSGESDVLTIEDDEEDDGSATEETTSFFDQEVEEDEESQEQEEEPETDVMEEEESSYSFDPMENAESNENEEDDGEEEEPEDEPDPVEEQTAAEEETNELTEDIDENEDDLEEEEPEDSATTTDEEESDEEQEEPEDESVNARYNAPSATVNDTFGKSESETVADQMEKRKVNSIMEAISVNHRYMFTKELFDGDRDAFTQAIDELESSDSFDGAVEKLVNTYAKEHSWDMNSEEVKELLKVVFRRFR